MRTTGFVGRRHKSQLYGLPHSLFAMTCATVAVPRSTAWNLWHLLPGDAVKFPEPLTALVRAYDCDFWGGRWRTATGRSWHCSACTRYSPSLTLTGFCRRCPQRLCRRCGKEVAQGDHCDTDHNGTCDCECFNCGWQDIDSCHRGFTLDGRQSYVACLICSGDVGLDYPIGT